MRQAGRSLPEYRAIRERHAFFEVAGTPELCAEVTLQPVRRHGVDAAVIFADIMSPVLGMGVDVELVEGVGPVVDRPIALARRRRAAARHRAGRADRSSRRSASCAASSTPSRRVVGFCGGPFTVAGYLVEGKPSRDFARTKSLMYREPGRVARAAGEARRAVRALRRGAGARRRRRDPALRLVGRRALARRLRGVRRAVLRAHPRRASDVPTIHFGTGDGDAARAIARAGGDVIGLDWRIPLDDGWERRRRRARRAGQPRSRRAARAVGARRGGGARRARARARGRPGPHLQPRPRRPAADRPGRGDAAHRARAGRTDRRGARHRERRGRPDGLRLARAARRRARVLRRHPRRPADRARAPRRSRRALPPARHRGLEPAERDHRGRRAPRSSASSACRSSPA